MRSNEPGAATYGRTGASILRHSNSLCSPRQRAIAAFLYATNLPQKILRLGRFDHCVRRSFVRLQLAPGCGENYQLRRTVGEIAQGEPRVQMVVAATANARPNGITAQLLDLATFALARGASLAQHAFMRPQYTAKTARKATNRAPSLISIACANRPAATNEPATASHA